jgi:mycofactocin system creatininase family protein
VTDLAGCVSPELVGSGALLVVPLGATEQHGPHLPLGADTDIAVALAQRLADRDVGVLIAPPLAYGSSGEHQSFAGTLSVGSAALELVLVELARSATETVSRVLFLSTHGGNAQPVSRAVRRLRAESRDVRSWSPGPIWLGDAHAGRTETSLLLALHPDRVHLDACAPGNQRPVRELMPALRAGGVAAVSPNGVLGDPRGASAAEGARLLQVAVDALVATVQKWPDARAWM